MDNFGIPTEINVGVMKAIAELENTAPDGFVSEKKICDHVVYNETDKDWLVSQSLNNLTFLEVLVRCGSSFALRQNLRFPSGASAIPWIDPRNQNKNHKRVAEMKRRSAAKKKKYAAKIDSYFTKYFEIYKNMKANEIPETPEINTGPEDTTDMLPPNALLEEQVLGNVNSKVKYTNHKKKRNFEDKKKTYSPEIIDSLFAYYFEKYKNIKTINNPENSKERTLENVQSKRKITMAKEIGNFKAMKKSYSCPELNFLFALKNIGDNPNVYVSKRGSILAPSGPIAIPSIDRRNQNKNLKRRLELNQYYAAKKKRYAEIPENPEINTGPEDTTKMLPPNALLEEQVLGNVNSKVKYTNHKKKRNFEDKKKTYSPEIIDSLFAFYFEKYKNIKTINNPENSEERTLESTGLDVDNIILQVSAPINDQTSKPMENVVENVQSKRKIRMAKEIGNFKAMKKSYSCPELNFLFALKNIRDNPNVYVSKRGSILGSLGLKKANNILSINGLKDQEYFSRWQFTDPLVI
ncbi:uncharacterized protein LOC133848910 [Drosophila sulfurigaster albostrigata]|uniref:uncharacterized protein LOC133848910 n=1 Tax=Drosophila sulfurigaster albostrigata TaxID=89887 RepID=UPI002D21CF54|nr:uncharacterized protein LOC133848910 [Drosophila sulfurigaster albostrigata]